MRKVLVAAGNLGSGVLTFRQCDSLKQRGKIDAPKLTNSPFPKLATKARVTGGSGGITNELGMSFRICKMKSETVDLTDKDFDKVIINDLADSPADTCRRGEAKARNQSCAPIEQTSVSWVTRERGGSQK
jgi:hypothetical protein